MSDQDRHGATRPVRTPHPRVEELEPRLTPSAAVALPQTAVFAGGLMPAQVRHAYGFDRISFGGAAGDGSGQTIAIVTAYDDPNIAADLATFDRQFGLPAPPSFAKVAMPGTAGVSPIWSLETALDVEWAHAMAPGAKLVLVEAATGNLGDLVGAASYARQLPGVGVVSMSWGSAELAAETYMDGTFTTPANHGGVAFVAASGDGGAAGALWPALSPNVLAVGGTQLAADGAGDYLGESAWAGSAGGSSRYEGAPAVQRAVTGSAARTGPDVSYNAAGYAVYTTVPINGLVGWMTTGGTSAGTPQWAALLAIADQGRALAGKPALTSAASAIYGLPAGDFHDVITGGNGAVSARPGYDAVTGRGSPYADRVVSGLVGNVPVNPAPTPAPVPPPIPSPAPANSGLSLTFIAQRVTRFLQKATGGGTTTATATKTVAVPTRRPALRLPSGGASFLSSSSWLADVLRAIQQSERRR
jgi:subtilase family serine protease